MELGNRKLGVYKELLYLKGLNKDIFGFNDGLTKYDIIVQIDASKSGYVKGIIDDLIEECILVINIEKSFFGKRTKFYVLKKKNLKKKLLETEMMQDSIAILKKFGMVLS